jgi:pilus assembly protein CpaC
MNRHSHPARALRLALIAAATGGIALGALPASQALAQTPVMDAAQSRAIIVAKDKSVAFRLDQPAGELVVAQPSIAEIVATTDRSFYVRGKALGTTNILVYDAGHRLIEVVDVRVGFDVAAVQADMAANFPNENITVRQMGDGFILTGTASNSQAASRAKALAERYAPKQVTSALAVNDPQSIVLEVRIVEVSRDALKGFGIDGTALSRSGNVSFTSGSGLLGGDTAQGVLDIAGRIGHTAIDTTLQALETKGVVHTLARPNLSAASGEEAEFLAGGEFPIPVPAGNGTIGIEFRPFGVNLKFKPELLDNGFIRMKVSPEVSALDASAGIRIQGVDVPGLTVRKASTTLDLRDGQSFAIAGLFQQDYENSIRQLPGVGDVPILGALFRSARWKRHETELVIIVTPRLTGPVDAVVNPLANAKEPGLANLVVTGKALDRPMSEPVGGEAPQSISDLLRKL